MSPEERITPASNGIWESGLLNPVETSIFLGVPVSTLKWWRRLGRGPSFTQVESRIRYPLRALREYLAERTRARAPSDQRRAPFYRPTRIEKLGEKHPGLRDFVEQCQRRRQPNRQIAAAVLGRWGERVSDQVLSNFYQLRVWPQECSEARERRENERGKTNTSAPVAD